jgi:predicted 2-oxoglutarate/Fe(II)-dependent dioxygenase YbiX
MPAIEIQKPDNFYIVAREPGAEHPAIPTWANESLNPAELESIIPASIERLEVESVPAAFQLLNVLSSSECDQVIELSESLGYLPDAAVSLPRSVRHNYSLTWVTDDLTTDIIWQRCQQLMNVNPENFANKLALGLNGRFRFYRYQSGDYFSPHTDGSWPGSKIIDRQLVTNAFSDRWSQLTFLLFLSDDYEGGRTQFYLPSNNQGEATVINVRTPIGGVLCFPHGMHPLHCLHGSEAIVSGSKYIIRSDVLFEL